MMHRVQVAGLLACLSVMAWAQSEQKTEAIPLQVTSEPVLARSSDTSTPPVEEYKGQSLDVKKVISIEHKGPKDAADEDEPCKAVPMEMLYKDSQGKTHDLEFKEEERNCSNKGR